MKKVLLATLAFVAFSAAQASAVTIDFTNAAWNPGVSDSITVGNTTVDSVPQLPSGRLYWSSLGFEAMSVVTPVSTFDPVEGLRVTFTQPFTLTSFLLNGLSGSPFPGGFMPEVGYYSINGSGWQAVAGVVGGNVTVTVAPTLVTSIAFGYDGRRHYNFGVESLTGDFQTQPTAVPEPTSMVLLGSGLLGLVARARRKKA